MKKLFCILLMALAVLACTALAEETLIPLPHDPNGIPVVFYQGNTVVEPGNAVGIRGEYLDQTWTATLTDGEKTAQVELLQQNRQSFKFVIPVDFKANTTYTLTLAGEKPLGITLNAPKVQWMQGDEGPMATVGGWVRVQGECMTLAEDAQHTLTLTAADGKVTTLNAEKVYDAYSVKFAIPELPLGDYTAVYSNGFAQDDAGVLTIGVSHEASWTKIYDVTKYKIDKTGGKDCTAMVNVLLGHVSNTGGGVLYFPKGTYRFSQPLTIPERVIVRGDGYENTQFWWDPMYREMHKYEDGHTDYKALKAQKLLDGRNGNFAIEGITFSAGHCGGFLTGKSNVRVENCRVIINNYLGINGGYNNNYWLSVRENLMNNAYSLFNFAGATNVKVTNCEFNVTIPMSFTQHGRGMNYLLVQNCTFEGGGGNCEVPGLECGIFEDCTVQGNSSAFKGNNIYYARTDLSDVMTGHDREIFTTDVGGTLKYQGGIEKGEDELTYVFPEGALNVEGHVKDSFARNWPTKMIILSGTGAGQWRNVVSATGNTVTIESPFDVQPDENSRVTLGKMYSNWYIVDLSVYNGGMFQFYCAQANSVIDGMKVRYAAGIKLYGQQHGNNKVGTNWYNSVVNCDFADGNYYHHSGPMNYWQANPVRQAETNLWCPPGRSYIATVDTTRTQSPAYSLCSTIRGNSMVNNCLIYVMGASENSMEDCIVDSNHSADTGVGIYIEGFPVRLLLNNNTTENVDVPVQYMTEGVTPKAQQF